MDLTEDGRYRLTTFINDAGVVALTPELACTPISYEIGDDGRVDVFAEESEEPYRCVLGARSARAVRLGSPLVIVQIDDDPAILEREAPNAEELRRLVKAFTPLDRRG